MQRAEFNVETLGCEVDGTEILEALLHTEGVLDAEVDMENEHVAVVLDEQVTSRAQVADSLQFYGLRPRAGVSLSRNELSASLKPQEAQSSR